MQTKNIILSMFILFLCVFSLSCGYTTGSALSSRLKTIHVEDFENNINYSMESSRNIYFPLLEVTVKDAVIDRFMFDGNLKIVDADESDLILKGKLNNYQRDVLRYTDDDEVYEYRVRVIVSLELFDSERDEVVWSESGFAGEATYFVSGSEVSTEESAVNEATVDLARRIVERTIENW